MRFFRYLFSILLILLLLGFYSPYVYFNFQKNILILKYLDAVSKQVDLNKDCNDGRSISIPDYIENLASNVENFLALHAQYHGYSVGFIGVLDDLGKHQTAERLLNNQPEESKFGSLSKIYYYKFAERRCETVPRSLDSAWIATYSLNQIKYWIERGDASNSLKFLKIFLENEDNKIKYSDYLIRNRALFDAYQFLNDPITISSIQNQNDVENQIQNYFFANTKSNESGLRANAYFYLGRIFILKGLFQKSIVSFENAVTYDPTIIEYRIHLGSALSQNHAYKESEKVLIGVVEISDNNFEISWALGELGYNYLASGKFAESRVAFEKSIHLYPNNPSYKLGLSRALWELNQRSEAIKIASQIITTFPEYIPGWVYLGIFNSELENWQEAIDALETAVVEDPFNIDNRTIFANILLRANKKEEAIDQFEEIVRLDPNNLNAKYSLGKLYKSTP